MIFKNVEEKEFKKLNQNKPKVKQTNKKVKPTITIKSNKK